MYSSLEVETTTSNGVGMSLTRTVFVSGLCKIPYHESGTTNTRIVDATMWLVKEVYMKLELLYGNKCRCGIFGGTMYVG